MTYWNFVFSCILFELPISFMKQKKQFQNFKKIKQCCICANVTSSASKIHSKLGMTISHIQFCSGQPNTEKYKAEAFLIQSSFFQHVLIKANSGAALSCKNWVGKSSNFVNICSRYIQLKTGWANAHPAHPVAPPLQLF